MRFASLLLVLLADVALGGRSLAQDATPAPGEFEIMPGVVAYDAVFAAGEEEPRTYRIRFDPGVTYPFEGIPSLDLLYVESGTATLRLDNQVTVNRPGATGENVAADFVFTITAGDYLVRAPFTTGEVRNDGQDPVVVSVASIPVSGAGMATPTAGTPAA